jgi:hypothetical protein
LDQVAVVVVVRGFNQLDEKFCAVRLIHVLARKTSAPLYPQCEVFATE